MNVWNKAKNRASNLELNEVISTIIGTSFSYFYLIYPVWLFPSSIIFDFFFFILLWIVNIIIVYYISFKLKDYEEELIILLKNFKYYF